MVRFLLLIIILFMFMWLLSMLYCKTTNKQIEFSLPIWHNAEFYVLITSEITKIGIILI